MIFFSFFLLIGRDWGFKKGKERGRGLFVCLFEELLGILGRSGL